MSLDLDNLEIIYERYYEISLQIKELIERGLYSELAAFISKKECILQESKAIADKIQQTGEDASRLAELCKKIRNVEKSNLDALIQIRNNLKEELQMVNKNTKLFNAYAISSKKNGNILDIKE